MLTLLRRGLLVFLAAFPLLSMAAPTPQQVVQGTVDELLSDIKANKAAYKADPQKLYATLDRILGPVVDAEGRPCGTLHFADLLRQEMSHEGAS